MTKKTPEPWCFNALTGYVQAADGRKIAEICERVGCDPKRDLDREEVLTVGFVMAAGPELLEACEGVAIMLRTALKECADEPWAGRVMAALAKARPPQPPPDQSGATP